MVNEFDAQKYRAASQHQFEWGARLIAELKLAGTESILDLGCGDGRLTSQLAALVPHGRVLGIDSSRSMLAAAAEYERNNVRFQLMDIADIDFNDEFDLVFSNATLQWVHDHRNLHRRVLHALRRGGRVRFNFAGDGNCSNLIAVLREVMAMPANAAYFAQAVWPWYFPSVDEYHSLVGECPYADARVWGENADRHFSDVDAMTKWIDQPSLVPLLAHVTDAPDKQRFRNEVVARMVARTRQSDGRCFETFRRINLLARKLG